MARKRTLPLIEDFDNIPEEALVPENEQPYKVPEHWKWVRLSSLNKYEAQSINPKKTPASYFFVYSVPSYSTGEPEYIAGEDIGSTKQVVETGDVLICKINPRINRVWSVSNPPDGKLIASSEWIVFRPTIGIQDFYRLYFSSQYFRQKLTSQVSGVGGSLTRARPKIVSGYPVLLPPPDEQKRIVEYIEQTNAKIDDVIQRLNQYLEEAPNRRAELIQAGVSGVLTKNWRDGRGNSADKSESMAPEDARKWGSSQILSRKHPKCDEGIAPSISSSELLEKSAVKKSKKLPRIADFDNIPEEALVPEEEQPYPIPEHWKWVRLGALLKYVQRGKGPKYANLETGYLAVSQKCVRWEGLDLTQARPWVASSFQDLNDVRLLREQDLLWNSTGTGTIGRIAVVPPLRENLRDRLAADSHVTVMRTTGLLDSKYLFYFISSIHIQGQVEDGLASGSTNQKELGLAVIKSLPIPLPLIDEQKEIACLLDAALSRVELNMELVQEVLDKVRGLRQQWISAALAGKLA
ncbi:hypothetical protein GSS87_03200 [Corynebacterium sp. 4HC-13]|uniref:restriction endonuclease subunit S n=1 Tax=Corynebacterium anserum TaxID=2684406 RepID=UPI00163A88AE|nr:restriction endonuclease subunit S [Corynebacterium anserum]MBC2681412.1 hypothetical protein [Corynebacterium anserum]